MVDGELLELPRCLERSRNVGAFLGIESVGNVDGWSLHGDHAEHIVEEGLLRLGQIPFGGVPGGELDV